MSTVAVDAKLPDAMAYLFNEGPRYIGAYGGRGGAKSIGITRRLLIRCVEGKPWTDSNGKTQRHRRILCTREIQSSIADSVHRSIADEIDALNMNHLFKVENATIYGPFGSEFLFKGLKFNVKEIKSTKGITDCWIEEANVVSKTSFEVLDPTVREPGSQIFMSLNPELAEDYIYDRFVVKGDPDADFRKIGFEDNPFFPEVLDKLRRSHIERDPDGYLNVWGGHPKQTLEGAVYAKELRDLTARGGVTKVLPVPGKPVSTFWDLGRSDYTSVWFAQMVGYEYRIIDFYEANGLSIGPHLQAIQAKGYVYDTHWLPHDATHEHILHPLSIEAQVKQAYPKQVKIVPKLNVTNGINAARTIFPNAVFDAEKCADGLNHLRRYKYKLSDTGHFSKEPEHDEHSHAADAFRYLAVALKEPVKTKPHVPAPAMAGGWLGR